MELKCLHCGYEFDGSAELDELGWHSSCPECGCSFDVDVYGCDGENHNCQQAIEWNNVNWFTSSIGFCDVCWQKLCSNLADYEIEKLYFACDAGNREAIDKVVEATK